MPGELNAADPADLGEPPGGSGRERSLAILVALGMLTLSGVPLLATSRLGLVLLALPLLGALLLLARTFYGILRHCQPRLGELLTTMAVGSLLVGLLSPSILQATRSTWSSLVLCSALFLWLLMGSAWGWRVAFRLGVISGWPRLLLLLCGWLLLGGVPCLLAAVFLSPGILALLLDRGVQPGLGATYAVLLLLGLLSLPGLLLERAIHRRAG